MYIDIISKGVNLSKGMKTLFEKKAYSNALVALFTINWEMKEPKCPSAEW